MTIAELEHKKLVTQKIYTKCRMLHGEIAELKSLEDKLNISVPTETISLSEICKELKKHHNYARSKEDFYNDMLKNARFVEQNSLMKDEAT